MKDRKYAHACHGQGLADWGVHLRISDNHFLLCCGISNDGSQDHHIREGVPRVEARADGSNGEDPFEGLDDND